MIDLGPHSFYIITAYAGVIVLTLGLVISVFANARHQQARLDTLEAQGHRRRSAQSDPQ